MKTSKSPRSARVVLALVAVLMALAASQGATQAGPTHSDFVVVKLVDKASPK